jgi:hypothetical protein
MTARTVAIGAQLGANSTDRAAGSPSPPDRLLAGRLTDVDLSSASSSLGRYAMTVD